MRQEEQGACAPSSIPIRRESGTEEPAPGSANRLKTNQILKYKGTELVPLSAPTSHGVFSTILAAKRRVHALLLDCIQPALTLSWDLYPARLMESTEEDGV